MWGGLGSIRITEKKMQKWLCDLEKCVPRTEYREPWLVSRSVCSIYGGVTQSVPVIFIADTEVAVE